MHRPNWKFPQLKKLGPRLMKKETRVHFVRAASSFLAFSVRQSPPRHVESSNAPDDTFSRLPKVVEPFRIGAPYSERAASTGLSTDSSSP